MSDEREKDYTRTASKYGFEAQIEGDEVVWTAVGVHIRMRKGNKFRLLIAGFFTDDEGWVDGYFPDLVSRLKGVNGIKASELEFADDSSSKKPAIAFEGPRLWGNPDKVLVLTFEMTNTGNRGGFHCSRWMMVPIDSITKK